MIPKIINYCWFGTKQVSESAQRCIDSWRKYCPDYQIIRWDENNIDINSVRYMKECYEKKAWGFVPDVARLQIIYNHGGIYLDTDVELIKSLDPLLKNKAFIGFENQKMVNLGLGFGAEKNNVVIKKLLDDYNDLHFINDDGSLNRVASPAIQTKSLMELGLKTNGQKQIINGLTVYPSEFFTGIDFNTGLSTKTEKTFSIHHYDGSWLSPEEKKIDELRKKCFKKYGLRLGRIVWLEKQIEIEKNNNGMKGAVSLILGKLIKNWKK